MRSKSLKRSGVAVAAGTLVLVAGATSASADVSSTEACAEYGWNYSTYSKTDIHIPSGVHWKNGPGGTVSASRPKSVVVLVPAGESMAAVGYQIQKVR